MRGILFRGQRVDTKEWVEGSLLIDGEKHRPLDKPNLDFSNAYIVPETERDITHCLFNDGGYYLQIVGFFVDPETVGQFTGLTDKNRKKIFEGDVVRQTFAKSVPLYASSWGSDEYEDICGDDVGVVVIIPSKGACIKNPIIHREVDGEVTQHGEKAKMYKPVCCSRCEVIGNIHDNPEMLEG